MGQTDLPKKPDPTVPLMIAKGFGVAPADTYFIGDSEVDVLTGKNAGMITLAVSWGFRDRGVLEEASPDFLFDTREELLNYFRNITD
jgi:phosphoglycolate phosphatase